MPTIRLPDGTQKPFDAGTTPHAVALTIGERLAEATIGARVAGELYDAHRPLPESDTPLDLALITAPRTSKKGTATFRDQAHETDALYLLRHSAAHVMAEALERLYPGIELAYGPPLEQGFYYDVRLETPISTDHFGRIEAEMQRIVDEQRPFTRYALDLSIGTAKLTDENNKYKLDNARVAAEKGATELSWYVTGPLCDVHHAWQADPLTGTPEREHWEDLCQGPHVDHTGRIGAFKLTAVAASHWHGDVTSDRFQRVYGTAFFGVADLEAHLEALEQARARDHRLLGAKLGLFTIDEQVGQGLVLWKPNGAVVRQELQTFITHHLERRGYHQVFTPHIGKLGLYKTSGHFPYYQDSQYPPVVERETLKALADEGCTCGDLLNRMSDGDLEGYLLKPMNCPHHIRIFASDKRSYRDLPVRLAEFGTVYRWEQSGELGGMTRVRGFTQDDAHLFVTEDQLADEVRGCLDLVKVVFDTLGMSEYRVRVGLRDPQGEKYVGDATQWDAAEAACVAAAESLGVPFSSEPGEAAFYGPKIDFVVKDVIGRDWQLGTVQVDYQLPRRFGLSYTGADNTEHVPVMIHRAPFGSMERFVGCLIEHFNGAFPLWLAPEQARVLPISEKFDGYARRVHAALRERGIRATLDADGRVGGRIAAAEQMRVPYMLVVGGKDEAAETVSVRHRDTGDLGAVPLSEFLEQITQERETRAAAPAD